MDISHRSCSEKEGRPHLREKAGPGYVIALAGNPNTGKTTIFNYITGLRQHTGNWPGKTVTRATGLFIYQGTHYTLVDLPGTYSLMANSADEEVARDFLCFGRPDATIAVVDATCLERNLNLVLQILEITPKVVVCVNLIDEARRKNITIDCQALSAELGVPVVPTAASTGQGIEYLKDAVALVAGGVLDLSPRRVAYPGEVEEFLCSLEEELGRLNAGPSRRWLALRLLDGEFAILSALYEHLLCSREAQAGGR